MELDERDPEELYDVAGSLGEGSYGAVWKATEKATGKTVAIKIISMDEDDLAELMREIEILQSCADDFIVDFHGAFSKNNDIWIIMELCEAGSASDLMTICQLTFSENEIKEVIGSVLLGLNYLHENRMIHRDIKAGNILLTDDGRAKLGDFGVSIQLTTANAKRRTVIGTPFWMAPEVIQELSYDSKADIWSLGITLIELAQSEPPYSNIHPMRAIFMIPNRPPPTLDDPESWSPAMVDFLAKCLTKDPDARPSASALMRHEFVASTVDKLNAQNPRGKAPLLRNLVTKNLATIEEHRLLEAQRQDQLTTSISVVDTSNLTRSNTAVLLDVTLPRRTIGNGNNRTLISHGTMVPRQDGGTFLQEPSFMAYFETPHGTVANPLEDIDPMIDELSDLRRRLEIYERQFHNDIVELRRAYRKRRTALEQAAVVGKGIKS